MGQPLVSIITVCYNSEKTIRNTIESVLSQTYFRIQYIIKDGNSSDNTNNIINEYKEKAKARGIILKHIIGSDNGIYGAMNEAVSFATGEWCLFLNSDDRLYNCNVLNDIFGRSDYPETKILFGGTKIEFRNKFHMIIMHDEKKLTKYFSLCHQSLLIRTEVMKKYYYNEEYKYAADYDFILKLYLEERESFHSLNMIISIFSRTGISCVKLDEVYAEVEKILINNSLLYDSKKRHYLYSIKNKCKNILNRILPIIGDISFIIKSMRR